MVEENQELSRKDRDLLVELRTEMKNVRSDIRDLKDGMSARVLLLERDKADRKDVEEIQRKVNDEIDVRVRKLEASNAKYFIVTTLYSVAVASMIALIIYHILKG